MCKFSIPLREGERRFLTFRVEPARLLFAGSRNITLDHKVSTDLVKMFGSLGFSFLTGCAKGVDESFRLALSRSEYKNRSIVACAFRERVERLKRVHTLYVVPDGLPPRAALAKRTLWMTSRCTMLILFPSDPIGRGSALAFKSVIMKSKPVFVVSKTRPADSDLYSVYPSSLFGIVEGYWCIPPVYAETGLCYEAV